MVRWIKWIVGWDRRDPFGGIPAERIAMASMSAEERRIIRQYMGKGYAR